MSEPGKLPAYVSSILSGVVISVAWWFPETWASALLGWVAACLLVFAIRVRRSYLPAYCCGLACCSLGFYWVYGTVAAFGGFGPLPSALLFVLFATSGAVQFLLFAFIHHNLGPWHDAYALRAATALVLSEFLAIRIFAWCYGHTQVAFTPLVQVADLGGAWLVSFLMFWVAEAVVRAVVFGERRRAFLVPPLCLGLALAYGVVAMARFAKDPGEPQEVVLVQGNISLEEARDRGEVWRSVARLLELSKAAARDNDFIVWPECSIRDWIPDAVGKAARHPLLPSVGGGSAALVGAFGFDREERLYNAAFAVEPDGTVPRPYAKQILIPFGEYTPFSSLVPGLKSLNPNAGLFTAGTSARVFDYPMRRADGTAYTLKVSPLICYEDTVPALARGATRAGAELLVNLTNDAWFGRSAAPYEHHLIAAFRAIENRRYLVRVTNTGLTAVVDPLGRTIVRLPIFTEGTARARVRLLREQSPYTRFVGDSPWWILLGVSLVVVVEERRRARRRG